MSPTVARGSLQAGGRRPCSEFVASLPQLECADPRHTYLALSPQTSTSFPSSIESTVPGPRPSPSAMIGTVVVSDASRRRVFCAAPAGRRHPRLSGSHGPSSVLRLAALAAARAALRFLCRRYRSRAVNHPDASVDGGALKLGQKINVMANGQVLLSKSSAPGPKAHRRCNELQAGRSRLPVRPHQDIRVRLQNASDIPYTGRCERPVSVGQPTLLPVLSYRGCNTDGLRGPAYPPLGVGTTRPGCATLLEQLSALNESSAFNSSRPRTRPPCGSGVPLRASRLLSLELVSERLDASSSIDLITTRPALPDHRPSVKPVEGR